MEYKGVIIGIFFPNEYKDGVLVDPIYNSIIGFKILLNGGKIIKITTNIDSDNKTLYKDDKVIVKEEEIDSVTNYYVRKDKA